MGGLKRATLFLVFTVVSCSNASLTSSPNNDGFISYWANSNKQLLKSGNFSSGATTQFDTITFNVGNVLREVHIYVPSSAPKGELPLVVDFHALASNSLDEALLTDFVAKADQEGFAMAYPAGLAKASWPLDWATLGTGYSFNAGGCCPDGCSDKVDDIQFARDIPFQVDAALKEAGINRVDMKRVFSTGMSNGGFMTNRVACQASDVYTAFAPVSGLYSGKSDVWESDVFACNSSGVPILHFHGTADPIVPFNGNPLLGFESVTDYFAGWQQRNKCKDNVGKVTYQNGDVTCTTSEGCNANTTLCVVKGGGHSWPGSTYACPSIPPFTCTKDIKATDAIWDFFKREGERKAAL